ncbi:phosphatidate cytidylyltransferase [Trichomonascus vanleenenianus]|uniref:phosphatidate cytidylyltransferase n=1 Tax=Trichomonascus vanleenenianus TaxID=2268995 RepID=UPI003EC9AE38
MSSKGEKSAAEVVVEKAPNPTKTPESKKQVFIVRTIWTLVMIAFFFVMLGAGHIWIIGLVALIQVLTFKEVINLASEPAREKNLPWGRSLNWYFLATTIYFLEGENVIYYFKHIVLVDTYLLPLATHHRFLSYCLYILGFVFFVYSLEKSHYRFQFTQFCMTHMTLLLVVVQAHFIVNNIFAGLFWFFMPAALVIANDIFAYLCGITFGRTQLIAISPKKTVEGFVGAWICTIIIGMCLSAFLVRFKYIICPVQEIGANVFSGLDCVPNPVFVKQLFPVPPALQGLVGADTIKVAPIHFHVMCLATFASLIAPFGGFFASGLKRTFQVKDFGDTIPGHGGITDRMDCQFLMGFFSYLYYESFVSTHHLSVGTVFQTAINTLTPDEQKQLVITLVRYLTNKGLLDDKALHCIE